MNTESILSLENRIDKNLYDIYILKEGTWWRMYEWSACLVAELLKFSDKSLKPTKKHISKLNTDIIQLGVPMQSFEKYFGDVININDFDLTADKIVINTEKYLKNENFEDHEERLKNWKKKVPFSSGNKKEKSSNENASNDKEYSVGEVINMIKNFDTLNSTPIEALSFINKLKNNL